MADWIYCGTNGQVTGVSTQSLLRTHQAIWCSPPGLRPWPAIPQPSERLWLVWREMDDATISLLGSGRILQAPRERPDTNLLWTDVDFRGMRSEAEQLGYTGGRAMTFIRLTDIILPDGQPQINNLGQINSRLNVATNAQVEILMAILPIA
jgi:hypothetical protein